MPKVYIIAEAGVNHNGRLDLAIQLCDAAKAAGVDAVKFQTWKTELIIAKNTEMADYQKANLNKYIVPNLIYDNHRSETERNDLLSAVTVASGMVISGQKVIERGDIVDEHDALVLSSFEREMQRRQAGNQHGRLHH